MSDATAEKTSPEGIADKILDYCRKTVTPSRKSDKLLEDFKTEWDSLIHKGFKLKRSEQIYNDSIHGSIEINSLEKTIINTLEFSRLKDIKQLGGKFYVYQGATHTRFEHSIGVCHLAGELIKHLRTQKSDRETEQQASEETANQESEETAEQESEETAKKESEETAKLESEETQKKSKDFDYISKEEELCVRLAGLCHDLGHGPFSHLFEKVAVKILEKDKGKKIEHERLSKLFFKKILLDNPKVLATFVKCGLNVKHVQMIETMITPEEDEHSVSEDKKFLFEIVANKESGMDVDKWDYFARDFLHLGATNEFDWRRCMLMSKVVKVKSKDDPSKYTYHIGFRDKEVANIYAMFRTRSVLYVKALYHKTVKAVEKMIEDVFYFARSMTYEGGKTLEGALHDAYIKEPSDLSGYMALTDYFFYLIRYSGVEVSGDVEKAKELINRLRKRELYKMMEEEVIHDCGIMKEATPEKKFDKMKEVIDKFKNKTNKEIKKYGSIELYCYKFSSEKSLNPLKKIYFYKKDKDEGDFISEDEDGIKDAPPLCKPEKLFECRIRLYQHETLEKKEKEDLMKDFKQCRDDIKKELKRISESM